MSITDAQVHIWAADSPERPWPRAEGSGPRPAQRPTPLEVPELLDEMDAANVARTVLVPPGWDGGRNDVALAAATDHPDRFGVMGRIDVKDPSSVDLGLWRDQPGMLGVRLTFFQGPQKSFLYDGTAEWCFSQGEKHNLPFMLYSPYQNDKLAELAMKHPEMRIIVDHLNLDTEVRGDGILGPIDDLLTLAPYPNVAVKISALPCHVNEPFPFPTLQPLVKKVIDAFSPERCVWGSDLSRLPCPYGDWVRFIPDALDFLTKSEVDEIMGGTLARWLDWP